MKKLQLLRIITFSGLILGLLFSNAEVKDSLARSFFKSGFDLTKTAFPTVYTEVGEKIIYTVVVDNNSDQRLMNVVVEDTMLTLTCDDPENLNVVIKNDCGIKDYGGTMTCTGTYTVTEADIAAGAIINNVSARAEFLVDECGESDETEILTAEGSATVTYVPPPPKSTIALYKNASAEFFTRVGETITYTYTIQNTGETLIEGQLMITDDKVSNISCGRGMQGAVTRIAANNSVKCQGTYITTEADVIAGSVVNQAVVKIDGLETSALHAIRFMGLPAVELQKSVSPTYFTEAGERLAYTFYITNEGNDLLSAPFVINDPLLTEWECPSEISTIPPGEVITCTGFYTIKTADLGNTLNNCATATAIYKGEVVESIVPACAEAYYALPEPEEEPPPPDDPPSDDWDDD